MNDYSSEGGDITNTSNQDKNIFNSLVIKEDSTWKGIFDLIMLIASVYNVFT